MLDPLFMRHPRHISFLKWFLASQLGFNPNRALKSARGIPAYIRDVITYKTKHPNTLIKLQPCLGDRYMSSGEWNNEYFSQDLLVSTLVHKNQPRKHLDIGSRVDGFVAHVASFMKIRVLDIRPAVSIFDNIIFERGDICDPCIVEKLGSDWDSISCLHTLEHIGLGRYGDTIGDEYVQKAIGNISRLLKVDSPLYLSIPVGNKGVCFNAHRVFPAHAVIQMLNQQDLALTAYYIIDHQGGLGPQGSNEFDFIAHAKDQEMVLCVLVTKKCLRLSV